MKPLVPSNPGPPKDPNSFWAPWPAIREPCAKRTINGAESFTLEPLDLAVFTLAPSVASLGLINPARGWGGPLAQAVYPRRFGYTPDFLFLPLFTNVVEQKFSEAHSTYAAVLDPDDGCRQLAEALRILGT